MPLLKGRSKKVISENIRRLAREGKSMDQAIAISYAQRKPKKKGKK